MRFLAKVERQLERRRLSPDQRHELLLRRVRLRTLLTMAPASDAIPGRGGDDGAG